MMCVRGVIRKQDPSSRFLFRRLLDYNRSRFERIVRDQWSKLTEEERAPYVRMTEEDGERFNAEMGEKVAKVTPYVLSPIDT